MHSSARRIGQRNPPPDRTVTLPDASGRRRVGIAQLGVRGVPRRRSGRAGPAGRTWGGRPAGPSPPGQGSGRSARASTYHARVELVESIPWTGLPSDVGSRPLACVRACHRLASRCRRMFTAMPRRAGKAASPSQRELAEADRGRDGLHDRLAARPGRPHGGRDLGGAVRSPDDAAGCRNIGGGGWLSCHRGHGRRRDLGELALRSRCADQLSHPPECPGLVGVVTGRWLARRPRPRLPRA